MIVKILLECKGFEVIDLGVNVPTEQIVAAIDVRDAYVRAKDDASVETVEEKIALLAELFNAQIAPHIYCGPVAHAAAAHVAFSSPNFLILETILTPFHASIVRKPLVWDHGYLIAPAAPGLGVELAIAHRAVIEQVVTAGADCVDETSDEFFLGVVVVLAVAFEGVGGADAVG